MKITIKSISSGVAFLLDPSLIEEFQKELNKTIEAPGNQIPLARSAPDCQIIIENSEYNIKTYELYGTGVVLHDKSIGKSWQFYFGRILFDLLIENKRTYNSL